MSRELTRRDFLGDAALVGVASAIGLEKALASQPNAAAAPPRVRQSSFDDGWSFAKGDIVGAQAPQFTASNWTPVIIPHDWSISGPFSESEPCGSEGAYLKQQLNDKLIEHRQYINRHGEDMPEIRDWLWPG